MYNVHMTNIRMIDRIEAAGVALVFTFRFIVMLCCIPLNIIMFTLGVIYSECYRSWRNGCDT